MQLLYACVALSGLLKKPLQRSGTSIGGGLQLHHCIGKGGHAIGNLHSALVIEVQLLLHQTHHIALLLNALGDACQRLLNVVIALSRQHELLRNQVRQASLLTNKFRKRTHALRQCGNYAGKFLLTLILHIKEHPKLACHGHNLLRVRRNGHGANGIDPLGARTADRGRRIIAAKEEGSERGKETGHQGGRLTGNRVAWAEEMPVAAAYDRPSARADFHHPYDCMLVPARLHGSMRPARAGQPQCPRRRADRFPESGAHPNRHRSWRRGSHRGANPVV